MTTVRKLPPERAFNMFHEYRADEAQPARLPLLIQRFTAVNTRLFQRYGFRPVGY